MPSDIEKLIKIHELERKKYEEAQRLADEALIRAMGSNPKVKDYEAAHNACETANKVAYQSYLKVHEINNAKSDAAFEQYQKTCEENNAKSRAAGEQAKEGKISHDDYLKIKKECDEANEKAYEEAKNIKAANDSASKDAYNEYLAIHEKNNKKMDTVKENYTKHNPSTPPPSSTIIQSPEAKGLVASYKDHFKKDDWYKDHEPKIEKDRIHLPFKSDKDAADFAQELAKGNKNFIMIDKETNKVLAYSKGDGKLYKGNGDEFKDGPLRPGKEDMQQLPTLDAFQKAQTPSNTPPKDDFALTAPKSSKSLGESIPEIPKEPEKEQPKVETPKEDHLSEFGNS